MTAPYKLTITPRRRRRSAAQDVLLPGEDQAEYEALEAQLFDDFAPEDSVCEALVVDLAAALWKKKRLRRIEQRLVAQGLSAPLSAEEFSPLPIDCPPYDQLRAMKLAFEVAPDRIAALYDGYQFATTLLQKEEVTIEDLNMMKAQHPEMWSMYRFHEAFATKIMSIMQRDDTDVRERLLALSQKTCREFLEKYAPLRLLIIHHEAILEAVRRVQDRRIFQIAMVPDIQRVDDELQRAVSRTLQELRKHVRSLAAANNRRAQYKTD